MLRLVFSGFMGFTKDEGTQDDQRRDVGTNFTMRIKEEKTRLTLQEYDDDDDDEDDISSGKRLSPLFHALN